MHKSVGRQLGCSECFGQIKGVSGLARKGGCCSVREADPADLLVTKHGVADGCLAAERLDQVARYKPSRMAATAEEINCRTVRVDDVAAAVGAR